MKLSVLPLLAIGLTSSAHAQISATGTYTQNFDTLASTGTSQTWTNNSTLPGWYGAWKLTNSGSYQALSNYTVAGTASIGGSGPQLLSYGVGSERSLGTVNDSVTATSFGARFANSGLSAIGGFSVSFDGEQWGRQAHSTPTPDILYFSYKIYSSGIGNSGLLDDTGWTRVSALDFTSPNWTDGSAANLDGEAAANRVEDTSAWIADVTLQPGQELWLRWTGYDEAVGNHGLAIDNLTVTFGAIPEPASFGALLALAGLGYAGAGRRRRA